MKNQLSISTTQSIPTPPTAAEQGAAAPSTTPQPVATTTQSGCSDGQLYGYIRVSTREQNEARQLIALQSFGVPEECVYMDKQSGKDFHRPAWQALLNRLTAGEISLPKWIQSHKSETALKPLEIRHFTAFATSSAALGESRFSVLCG